MSEEGREETVQYEGIEKVENDEFVKQSEKGDMTEHWTDVEDKKGLNTLNPQRRHPWRTAQRCVKRAVLLILGLFVAALLLDPFLPDPYEEGEL